MSGSKKKRAEEAAAVGQRRRERPHSSSSSSSSSSPPSSTSLPAELEDMRRSVFVGPLAASNTASPLSPDAFTGQGEDGSLTLSSFSSSLRVEVQELSRDRVLFELVGVDAALANALRRLLLAELPSLAIEKVVVFQNTSILPDEVLAHRLGLLPLRADPRLFSFTEGGAASELNTLVFTLDVACTRLSGVADTAAAEDRFSHSLVTSADVRWQPQGRQAEALRAAEPRVYYPDIVIAKLRPGQSIECEMHAEKGRGQQHAKWSPVATASYRMLPDVRIVQPVTGERARQLKAKCPMDVFDIEDVATGAEQGEQQQQQLWRDEEKQKLQQEQRLPAGGAVRAVVARPRNCSMCRECIRGPGWSDSVQLRRERRHFLFSVETTGAYSPPDAVREAVRLLKAKAQAVREELDRDGQQQAEAEDDGGGDDD